MIRWLLAVVIAGSAFAQTATILFDGKDTIDLSWEWDASRIVVSGSRVEHWLNGRKVLECELGSSGVRGEGGRILDAAAWGDRPPVEQEN